MLRAFVLLVCGLIAATLSAQECAPLPDDFVGFSAVHYVTEPDSSGDRLVAGAITKEVWTALRNVPAPAAADQQFCGSVQLGPGLSVTAYVPTSQERNGDHSGFGAQLYDPSTATGGTFPSGMQSFPGNIIPSSRLLEVFAFRIAAVDPAAISDGGVVHGASFADRIAPGGWVTIYGINLSRSTRAWSGSDFTEDRLPVILDDVEVTINGLPAAVYFISPGQLNVQCPDTPVGVVSVQVSSPFGVTAVQAATVAEYAPGWFTAAGDGVIYPAAVHPSGILAGRPGLYGNRVPTYQARPGGIVLLYGTGFGPSSPPVEAGKLFTGAAPLADPSALQVTIGGVEATVSFAGITGAGLYQFNVTVPDLPPGDHPLDAHIGSATTQPGVVMAVNATGVVSEGSGQISGTWVFDFDIGYESDSRVEQTADVGWNQITKTERTLGPAFGALITNLGVTSFDAITLETLRGLPYSSEAINGNDDETNQLVVGDVFAVKTNSGNYAKVIIDEYGYTLHVRWVTYAGP